jgi:hypothetical protein
MDLGFLSSSYPAGDYTNRDNLFMSLGSFWTQVFQEQGTLRGYTLAMAEELIQSYYNLIDILNSYSVKDVPVLARTKWQPLVIKKSEFNHVPIQFAPASVVFGAQPASDSYYAGQTFLFGKAKTPSSWVYSLAPNTPLRKFSVVADRVIGPKVIYVNGVDVIIDPSNVLYFNSDPFQNSSIPRAAIINDNGTPATFVDNNGDKHNDELIILWCYNAENDKNYLYDNFGILFDFKLPSSEKYKAMLQGVFNLFVSGPTVNAIKSVMAAFTGVTPVVNTQETIQDVYSDNIYKYVITDKEVYRFDKDQNLMPGVKAGKVVYGGEILVDVVQYYDALIKPNWWSSVSSAPQVGLSTHIFLGDYKHQLFFSTSTSLVTLDAKGKIVFPVLGTPGDVLEFNKFINLPENINANKKALGLKNPGNTAVIVPANFIFNNFIKNNTALLKFNFYSPADVSIFFSYYPLLQKYLPAHIYTLLYVNLNLSADVYGKMNSRYSIPALPGVSLSVDGSNSDGSRPTTGVEDSNYYKDYKSRLFSLSKTPSTSTISSINGASFRGEDGTGQNLYCPINSLLSPSGSFTFTGWFRATENSSSFIHSIIGGPVWDTYMIRLWPNGKLRFDIYRDGIDPLLNGASGYVAAETPNSTVQLNTWHFFTAAFNSSTQKAYISVDNGTVYQSTAVGTSKVNSRSVGNNRITIAGACNGAAQFFQGAISSIGYWNTLLTTGQITALYNSGVGLTLPPTLGSGLGLNLVSWWELDEPAGSSTYIDSAPYVSGVSGGNHLIQSSVNNATTLSSSYPRPAKVAIPLHSASSLDQFTLTNTQRTAGIPRAFDGKVFTSIPATNPPPTNATVPTVLLIDFS